MFRFWMGLIGSLIVAAIILLGIGFLVVDHIDWMNEQQHKQDKCLAAGGMWIDNQNTDSYCFFNK